MRPYYEDSKAGITIYCGDNRDILPHIKPVDLVLTDPPYNVGKDYGRYKDNLSEEEYLDFMKQVLALSRGIAKNQAWVAPRYKMALWTSLMPNAHLVAVMRRAAGPYRGGWSDQFETILCEGKPNRCVPDLWKDIRLKGEGYFFTEETHGHPGYTPYKIMYRCAEILSKKSLCDPFMGTGTSARAAKELGREYIGIEIEEAHCETAVEIIENTKQQILMKV